MEQSVISFDRLGHFLVFGNEEFRDGASITFVQRAEIDLSMSAHKKEEIDFLRTATMQEYF